MGRFGRGGRGGESAASRKERGRPEKGGTGRTVPHEAARSVPGLMPWPRKSTKLACVSVGGEGSRGREAPVRVRRKGRRLEVHLVVPEEPLVVGSWAALNARATRSAADSAMAPSTWTSSTRAPKRRGLRRATKRATFDDATATVNTKGRLDRAFKDTGGDARQKVRMFETWFRLRLSREEEVDGVSQRVPGSGRGTPRKIGATVVKQSRRRSSWNLWPGLHVVSAPALVSAAGGATSPCCTEQSVRGLAGEASEAWRTEALCGGGGCGVGAWFVAGMDGGGSARGVAACSLGSRASA